MTKYLRTTRDGYALRVGNVVVDNDGVSVPDEDAPAIIEAAASVGLTLEVSDTPTGGEVVIDLSPFTTAQRAELSTTFAGLGEDGNLRPDQVPPGLGGGSTATALYPLNVPTHDGMPGAGHPDVLYVPGGFAGFKFWMGYTPLPGTAREVPIVLASHDGITWENPAGKGITPTPLATYAELDTLYPGATTRWWSDTDLVLSPDGTTLMLYFRATATGTGATNDYWLATSTNGLTWSRSKIVTGGALESPAVIVEDDNTFTMYAVHSGNHKIEKRTSADGITWSERTVCTNPTLPAGNTLWHMDAIKVDGVYHALMQATTTNSRTMPFRLFHWTSTDGQTWTGDTTPSVPLSGSRYDAQGTYRSTLQPAASGEAGKFDLWLQMIDDTRTSNHTAAVSRIGVIKDYDFSADSDLWNYPAPPLGAEAEPLDGDSFIVPVGSMVKYAGSPVLEAVPGGFGQVGWKMLVDDYVTVAIPYLPRGWHRVAVDVLCLSHTALDAPRQVDPRVAFQCVLYYSRVGMATSGTAGNTVSGPMPAAVDTLAWVRDAFDGSLSTTDVRRDGLTWVKIRRRGTSGSTYTESGVTTALPVYVVGVRFRRV